MEAAKQRCSFALIATKGTPVRDYLKGVKSHPDALNLLLLDSDRPPESRTLEALCQAKGIGLEHKERVFWMVEVMETWFLSDREALSEYYGQNFHEGALPRNSKLELISKQDVLDGLKSATLSTGKGAYHKTKHAPALLRSLDARKVEAGCPHCKRLFEALRRQLAS